MSNTYIYKKQLLTRTNFVSGYGLKEIKEELEAANGNGIFDTGFEFCNFDAIDELVADFDSCTFIDSKLSPNRIIEGKFSDCQFDHCKFSQLTSINDGLEFSKCCFANCTFSDFEYSNYIGFKECRFINCVFEERTRFSGKVYGELALEDCTLYKVTIQNFCLDDTRLINNTMFHVKFSNVQFNLATITDCHILSSTIEKSKIEECWIEDFYLVNCSIINNTIDGVSSSFERFVVSNPISVENNIIKESDESFVTISPYKVVARTKELMDCRKDITAQLGIPEQPEKAYSAPKPEKKYRCMYSFMSSEM